MRSPPKLRLATHNGRRIGKVPKAKRLAAQPATDAACLMRSLAMIRAEADKLEARAEAAEKVLMAASAVAGGDDRTLARAIAREAVIECGYALKFGSLARMIEMAEEGTLCA